jgi:diadenosine tetraphosphate (Ap4A) HIT family hydrolase
MPWTLHPQLEGDTSPVGDLPLSLKAVERCDKLNVAALGNVVPQLHVHVIARRRDDPAWPGPVWGAAPARGYDPAACERLVAALRRELWPEK